MTRGSRVLAVVGVGAVAFGLVVLVDPGVARTVGLSPGEAVVTVLALLALVQGILAVVGRITGERRAAALPEVEARERATVPGHEFDEALASLPERGPEQRDRIRTEVRSRLESVAVRVLVRRGLSESAARRHLEDGTWTADDSAAEFFLPPTERSVGLGTRIRSAVGAQHLFQRRATRTVAAIAAHADGEAPLPGQDGTGASTTRDEGGERRAGASGATGGTTAPAGDGAATDGGGERR